MINGVPIQHPLSANGQPRPSTISANGAHILGDNLRDYKRFLEIEKMNQTQKQNNQNISTSSIQTATGTNFVPTAQNLVYPSRPLSRQPPTPQQPIINYQPSGPSNDYLINEINALKISLAKCMDTQNELQGKVIDYTKIISEQENIIRLNNLKLNEHDSKITEILLTFNNYIQLNDKSSEIVAGLQAKITDLPTLNDYTELKSTVYTLNKQNETKINELSQDQVQIKENITEMSKSNEAYQKFTLEKIKNVQTEAMESRLQQQNELIKMDESKEGRINAQFAQVKNFLNLLDKNLREETDFRKKMVDGLRDEVFNVFTRNDDKFTKLEKTQLETEKNLIHLNKDYISTFNDLITKHNEKYDIELKAIRSIIEGGLTKVDIKLDKDNIIYEENFSALTSKMVEQKGAFEQLESYVKDTVNTVEQKLELSRNNNTEFYSKFDLISATLDKYMKENLDLINKKCEDLSKEITKKYDTELDKIKKEEGYEFDKITKKIVDIDEKIEDIQKTGVNANGNQVSDGKEKLFTLEKVNDVNIELVREYIDKSLNTKLGPVKESVAQYEDKLNNVMKLNDEEVKRQMREEMKNWMSKVDEAVQRKADQIKSELDEKRTSDKSLLDGRIQDYVLEGETRIRNQFEPAIKKIQDDIEGIVVKIGVGL